MRLVSMDRAIIFVKMHIDINIWHLDMDHQHESNLRRLTGKGYKQSILSLYSCAEHDR